MRTLSSIVAMLATMIVVRIAGASPSAKLVYVRGTGAESCPGEADLRKDVAMRLGYDPFFPVARKTVVAQVSKVPGGHRGHVQIVGDDGKLRGERDLATKGDDCRELVHALALAVSVALDDLDEAPPPPTSTSAPEEPPVVAPEVAAPPPEPLATIREAAPPPPEKSTPVHVAVAVGPTFALGVSPAPAPGGAISFGLRFSSVALRLEARGDLPTSEGLVPVGKLSTNSFTALALVCLRAKIPFACLGGGTGLFASRTEGLARTASDSAALGLAAARVGASFDVGSSVFLEPFVDVGLSLARHRVDVDDRNVFELPLLWGAGGVLLGVSFL